MMKGYKHIVRTWMMMLLLMAGAMNGAWAAKVTYHILTLPIDPSTYDYHMKSAVTGYRLEAFKVVVDGTTVELPAHYKSPLATNFTYYKPEDITGHGTSAIALYDNGSNKGVLYQVEGEETPLDASDDATPVAEGTPITTVTEFYVTYSYNASNTIAQLDGSVKYNIGVNGKGFLSLNRGRNNRPAVMPTAKVDPEILSTEDFSYIDNPGSGITTYWSDGKNKNKREDTESKFHFVFKFEGKDPYHIIIRTAYAKDTTYIEQNDNVKPEEFVYKWYKGGSLFGVGTANCYIASDEHKRYNIKYNTSIYPINPTDLREGDGLGYIARNGNFHGQTSAIWGTVALLNNTSSTGYVLMGSRTVDGNGAVPAPTNDNKYYYLKFTNNNNMNYGQITAADATKNHYISGLYPIKKVTFKIATPFYAVSPTSDHIISASGQVSQYTVDNDPIETKYLPASLRRKYCQYTGKFYKDPACTQGITKFSEANYDPTEGYQVYVGYELTSNIPFKAISPSASYTTATWYELTDEGSTQEYGKKIKNNSGTYKNNGANGEYTKASEFAFVGDPYELKVLYRDSTEEKESNYYVTLNTYDTWDIPTDNTSDAYFMLRKYKDANEGKWAWDAGQTSVDVTYQSNKSASVGSEAQTITLHLTGLTGGKYIMITTGGTGAGQIVYVSPTVGSTVKETGSTATITVKLAANSDISNKTMTVTIQEYNDNEGSSASGTASVVTITQGTSSSFAGNEVDYSTTNSTRVKVLELPKHDFTYNIVDKSGRIAVKATANQTIFSSLSLASIPSIIVSPFLYGETVTFYRTFDNGSGAGTGTSRTHLSNDITQLTAGDAASATNVYVKYTTSALNAKPIKLSEDEEFNVKLNDQYVYYDKTNDTILTTSTPSDLTDSVYLWKLRNRDPYAMLIDNLGARSDLGVSGTETVTVYDDAGTGTSATRQKGAWLKLAAGLGNDVKLTFDADRVDAQPFVAKASLQAGVYEVMVADGGTVDALTTYYNIGRPDDNIVKIYNNDAYAHGKNELRFVLNQNVDYTYHLIDKAKHELLTATSKTPDLALPAEYQSPLVGTYYFYAADQITVNTSVTPHEYTPTDPDDKLSNIADLFAEYTIYESTEGEYTGSLTATDENDMKSQANKLASTGDYYYKIGANAPYTYKKVTVTRGYRGTNIYVTYDVNDVVTFNTAQYMLHFLNPLAAGYYLEDGNDKLTTTQIQAVYPYCNGDGNLNIYGNEMQKEQFNGGASTRPRWVWYFDSQNRDPYHVRIRSKSTINYGGVSHNTYLTTYAVHFNQDALATTKHIVTGGTLPGVASAIPTEYMVLGSAGNYKLMTTNAISDGVDSVRRSVTSFEQYWKTYNMLKLCILGLTKSTDAYSDDPTTWVVPTDPVSYRTTIEARGWHSYNAYANATRWNGYNDKSNGAGSKVVEKLEHWFQTFEMGDGAFDIESADIPPVLVLLDRHGWEIMRRPLPKAATYPEGEELDSLRMFDSPMVDKYYFYSNATKASGCHKYTMRTQNGAERDQVKVNGVRYSSTSLGDLPPVTATGVVSGGAIQDLYVIYDVKEEYEHNYSYTLTLNEVDSTYTESGISQPYLMVQNGRFYKTENDPANKSYITKPVFEHTNPTGGNIYDLIVAPANHGSNHNIIDGSGNFYRNNFWYLKPNLNIDEEMGIPWQKVTGEETVAKAKYVLKKQYKDKTGFDPYNLQIQLVNNNKGTSDGRFLTTHINTVRLVNGILVGDYTGKDYYEHDGSTFVTLEAEFDERNYEPNINKGSEDYDHTYLQISNQTFMAVSDANGNLQLMPRFDHTKRVNVPRDKTDNVKLWSTTLEDPVDHAKASADDNESMGPQTTFFVCPQRFHYHIIDNYGREALGYKRGADFYPAITEHFKSPVAKNFTFYKGLAVSEAAVVSTVGEWRAAQGQYKRTLTNADMLTDAVKLLPDTGWYYYQMGTRGVFTYKKVHVTTGLTQQHITGSFSEAEVTGVDPDVYVRYEYDLDADLDADRLLQGQWYTVQLAEKDLQASGTLVTTAGASQGTGVNLYAGNKPLAGGGDADDKPATINADAKKWQWKFFVAPADSVSDYYVKPDPYAVHLFNRQANYTKNPSLQPSPMSTPIKVPNSNGGPDRFALLSHPDGGYALVVAKTYDMNYEYRFVNGANMTTPDAGTPVAADTVKEANFNYKTGTLTSGAQLILNDDVEHHFAYLVITNDSLLAITATQDNAEARSHGFAPYLPDNAQSPLLNPEDYKYYGFTARPNGKYGVIPQTILYSLSGLYDDTVYVRYEPYDMDKTSFKVPNKKTVVDGHVARDPSSIDVSMNINGGLPYNIFWYNDTIMQSTDDATVSKGGSHALAGSKQYVWYIHGNDPYALKIKHKGGKFLNGTSTMVEEAGAPTFMLLRKDNYDYGILQKTGLTDRLTEFGASLTTGDPNHYVIFGLSIHDLKYHLIIANTGNYVAIPYREGDESTYQISGEWLETDTIHVMGTSQRDLASKDSLTGVAGEKYQLGTTQSWGGNKYTYCKDIGPVSIGDELVLPNEFARPNCTFEFYIEGIYQHYAEPNDDEGKPYEALDNKYKGLKLDKLMSDEQLVDQDVVVNIVYSFDKNVATNTGMGFVTSVDQNLWYTFETYQSTTPYLAQYTNAWGLQAKAGRETRYTNDYLWTPLGDVYGFKMYNRYMLKNTNGGTTKVMTTDGFAEGKNLLMAEPGTGNEIYELIPGDVDGYFRVHPVMNNSGTRYYVYRDPEDNYTKLSTTPCDWRYGLEMDLLTPYYERAGYVGGLTDDGKTAYEAAVAGGKITDIQNVVYSDANIIHFSTGYYRLHNQPGVSGISPVRYASGYLHDIEKTAKTGKAIPMHFFSREGVSAIFDGAEDDLNSGFTETPATRGEVPIAPTENDPSTIFYINGALTENNTISEATMSTQGVNVSADTMTTKAGMNYTFIDIGGAILLIADKLDPATRKYFCFDQTSNIYDIKFAHDVPTDDAKWCLQPVQKTATKGYGEMPLKIATNNGGDGYYYATFYAPFDVLLPADGGGATYNAYTCSQWYNDGVHPVEVPAVSPYAKGKLVPAGTPVIIRVKDESGTLTLTLPNKTPSTPVSCVFKGSYLEKLLPVDADNDVYTLGVPFISDVQKDADYETTGDITAPLPEFATSGVGFYINATYNKESDPLQSLWQRNNRYVLHNKIYYRDGNNATAPGKKSTEFVPVLFEDEEQEQKAQQSMGESGIYDILGRRYTTLPETPGIYIVNGQKIVRM